MKNKIPSNLIILTLSAVIFAGLIFAIIGTYLVGIETKQMEISLFELSIKSTNIGMTAIFIGAGIIIIGVQRILQTIDNLPPAAEEGKGGDGGSGKVIGNNGTVIGGKGGQGGPGGKGGDGIVQGDGGLVIGGDGGHAGTADGRGGKGARPEKMDMPTETWKYGCGGAGANAPEYNRRLIILKEIRIKYIENFPDDIPYLEAGVDIVPMSWINKSLEERNENWRVELGNGGYVLPPLSKE